MPPKRKRAEPEASADAATTSTSRTTRSSTRQSTGNSATETPATTGKKATGKSAAAKAEKSEPAPKKAKTAVKATKATTSKAKSAKASSSKPAAAADASGDEQPLAPKSNAANAGTHPQPNDDVNVRATCSPNVQHSINSACLPASVPVATFPFSYSLHTDAFSREISLPPNYIPAESCWVSRLCFVLHSVPFPLAADAPLL
ncbi:hypothetical protein JAAARDRAFT_626155 [Jaapia argillacea MUCL 33604]|uniref:Uncharacterized protein n=1 Tax=Jaapia argillacea MUCL 33604 TaxID=933084 RepID=A0A067PXN9_9AGAM|nr:hypothetical protein JAAARDRAFT_626155 [Jaapia argillacea MUCL 33604]